MFEDSFNPFPQFDEPAESNHNAYGDDGLFSDVPPFDSGAWSSGHAHHDDLDMFHTGEHNESDGLRTSTTTANEFHVQQQAASFYTSQEFSMPKQEQMQQRVAPLPHPQVRTARPHMLISQGSSSSLNSACDSPLSAGMNTPSAQVMLSQLQKVAQQQAGTPQTPQKHFAGGMPQSTTVHHQQTPEKFMDEHIAQYFRHQQQLHSYSTYMQTMHKQQAQSFQDMGTAADHAFFSQAALTNPFPHSHQQMYLYQRPYFPQGGSVTSPAHSLVQQPDAANQLCAALSTEHNITAPVPALAVEENVSPSTAEDKSTTTQSRSPVSQPKSPISPSEAAAGTAAGNSKTKKKRITRKQRPTITVPPPQDATPSTPARDVTLSSPHSASRRKTLEEKVVDAELAASENTPHTPQSARGTRKRSNSTNSDGGDSPKGKSQMPCSIIDCKRMGSRLMESLKGALDQKLKTCPSGRVCEAHYRQDLRAHKKMSKRSLDSDFARTDEFGSGADATPVTPTPKGGSKKRKASSSAANRSSKRAKKI